MRRTTLALPLAALAVIGGSFLVRGAGAADPSAPGQGRTAVVDIVALLNAAPRKHVIENDNAARKQAIDKYADDEQERIKELRKKLVLAPEHDPSRRALETEFARAKYMFEFDMKVKVADAEAAYSAALETLYEEVRGATRQVAEEQGFAMVLNIVQDRLDLHDSPSGFVPNVAARPVLYASNALDITSLVKARLEGARPPAPAPTPAPTPAPAPVSRPPLPPAPPPGPGALPPPSAPSMR